MLLDGRLLVVETLYYLLLVRSHKTLEMLLLERIRRGHLLFFLNLIKVGSLTIMQSGPPVYAEFFVTSHLTDVIYLLSLLVENGFVESFNTFVRDDWFVLNGFGYLHCLVNLIPKTACEVFELRRNFFVDWNLTSLVHFLFMRVVLAYLLDMAIHIVLTVPLHLAHVSFIAHVP